MRRTLLGLSLLFLTGCASNQGTEMQAQALTTQEIKQNLIAHRSELWKDPGSIRDASIGQAYSCPRHGGFSGLSTTCICIELNAKNSMGGYTGLQKKVAVYRGATVDVIKDWDFDDRCDAMEPFPEFNGDYRAAPLPASPKRKTQNRS
jgi:hypothetical protein